MKWNNTKKLSIKNLIVDVFKIELAFKSSVFLFTVIILFFSSTILADGIISKRDDLVDFSGAIRMPSNYNETMYFIDDIMLSSHSNIEIILDFSYTLIPFSTYKMVDEAPRIFNERISWSSASNIHMLKIAWQSQTKLNRAKEWDNLMQTTLYLTHHTYARENVLTAAHFLKWLQEP